MSELPFTVTPSRNTWPLMPGVATRFSLISISESRTEPFLLRTFKSSPGMKTRRRSSSGPRIVRLASSSWRPSLSQQDALASTASAGQVSLTAAGPETRTTRAARLARELVAMCASIVIWLGVWQLLDMAWSPLPNTLARNMCVMVVGFALLIITDLLFAQSYFGGTLGTNRFIWLPLEQHSRVSVRFGGRVIRMVLAFLGVVSAFLGVYDTFDIFTLPKWAGIRRSVFFAVTGQSATLLLTCIDPGVLVWPLRLVFGCFLFCTCNVGLVGLWNGVAYYWYPPVLDARLTAYLVIALPLLLYFENAQLDPEPCGVETCGQMCRRAVLRLGLVLSDSVVFTAAYTLMSDAQDAAFGNASNNTLTIVYVIELAAGVAVLVWMRMLWFFISDPDPDDDEDEPGDASA